MRGSVYEHSAIFTAIGAGEADTAHRRIQSHVNLQGEQITDLVRQIELDIRNRASDPLNGSTSLSG